MAIEKVGPAAGGRHTLLPVQCATHNARSQMAAPPRPTTPGSTAASIARRTYAATLTAGSRAGSVMPTIHEDGPPATSILPDAPTTPSQEEEAPASRALLPSLAPGPSRAAIAQIVPSYAGSLMSRLMLPNVHPWAEKGWFENKVCVQSPYNFWSFQPGDVISVPWHVPNVNPRLDVNSPDFSMSNEGPVNSKRRMGAMRYRTSQGYTLSPLYSWNKMGILKMLDHRYGPRDPKNKINDYVELVNDKYRHKYTQKGPHRPVYFKHKDDNNELTEFTTLHIMGDWEVNFKDNIAHVGRLTKESFEHMMNLRDERLRHYRANDARLITWPEDRPNPERSRSRYKGKGRA